jgi:ABC-type sulfate/molybdate transport systems ATPase subunit
MRDNVYSLEDLRYVYPDGPSPFSLELESLRLDEGDILALVGPNGAGKTTLMNLLALLSRPSGGRLLFRGRDPWRDETHVLEARRQAVLVTHHPYLFKGTVAGNLSFGLKVRDLAESERAARVAEALELVELPGWEGRSVAGLSAGQAQRVALARALALRPAVLLLDEPTANIEAGLGLRMEAVLREVARHSGMTVVFSTHNFSQASRLADDILYLSEGRRVEFGHENCFSGRAEAGERQSWIEPRPGSRIVFPGTVRGRVTCVINPADIRIIAADKSAEAAGGPNVFAGRVTRMETTEAGLALVRVSGDLTFRVTLPVSELDASGISLSRPVLIKFEPGSVEIVGTRPQGNPHA